MAQLRSACLVVAIIASICALISVVVLFFAIEPPFLVSIFIASGAIAIACFLIAGATAYFIE